MELAHFYAEKRGIPKDQVIGLRCSKAEEITRGEYDQTIAEPLRKVFTRIAVVEAARWPQSPPARSNEPDSLRGADARQSR